MGLGGEVVEELLGEGLWKINKKRGVRRMMEWGL